MTTIAYDGRTMVADRLAVDYYGLTHDCCKIIQGSDWVAGIAGEQAQQVKFKKATMGCSIDMVLNIGYPNFERDKDDPAILLVNKNNGDIWKHSSGLFLQVSYPFYAIGSGRDYALAALYLGKESWKAVEIASHFDNNTGLPSDQVVCE